MTRYGAMRYDLLDEFQSGSTTVEKAVRKLNKKRKKESRLEIKLSTARTWWKRFQTGDFSLKRQFVDNCELKIVGARCSHACRLTKHDTEWTSSAFNGRFLVEFKKSTHDPTLCIIDTFHGRKRFLNYAISADCPLFNLHFKGTCLDCKQNIRKDAVKKRNQKPIVLTSSPESSTPSPSSTSVCSVCLEKGARCLRINDIHLIDSEHCLILDYTNKCLYLVEMDLQASTFHVRFVLNNKKSAIKMAKTIYSCRGDMDKFALAQKEGDAKLLFCQGELDFYSQHPKLNETVYHLETGETLTFEGQQYVPNLTFVQYTATGILGLGKIRPGRGNKVDLGQLYEYGFAEKTIQKRELDTKQIERHMNLISNRDHPHAWIGERLYVLSRNHTKYNRTSILVMDQRLLEWSDLNINVNGSITAMLTTGSDDGILMVRIQKLVPTLQDISRYVRLPTSRPDNLVMLVWVRIRNYCEKHPPHVTQVISSIIPPILQCPFGNEEELNESDESNDMEESDGSNDTSKIDVLNEIEEQRKKREWNGRNNDDDL